VLCLWLSLWHGFGLVVTRRQLDLDILLSKMVWDDLYFWGALATIGMIVLGITSNNLTVKLFKRAWKKIHYIIYPRFLFAILHIVFYDFEEGIGYILLGVLYIVIKVMVWKKVQVSLPKNIL
jgi:DMSO/TMAO reductase YedYZ heme-binding membrane subunit